MTETHERIEIRLNGRPYRLTTPTTVAQLLVRAGFPRSAVAVELNQRIVARADHDSTALAPGDTVEVVSFVGGG